MSLIKILFMSFVAMKAIKVSESDNLLVALQNLTTGETIETKGGGITIRNPVSAKHKIAATDIGIGEKAFMYGVLVGEATRPIFKGERIT